MAYLPKLAVFVLGLYSIVSPLYAQDAKNDKSEKPTLSLNTHISASNPDSESKNTVKEKTDVAYTNSKANDKVCKSNANLFPFSLNMFNVSDLSGARYDIATIENSTDYMINNLVLPLFALQAQKYVDKGLKEIGYEFNTRTEHARRELRNTTKEVARTFRKSLKELKDVDLNLGISVKELGECFDLFDLRDLQLDKLADIGMDLSGSSCKPRVNKLYNGAVGAELRIGDYFTVSGNYSFKSEEWYLKVQKDLDKAKNVSIEAFIKGVKNVKDDNDKMVGAALEIKF